MHVACSGLFAQRIKDLHFKFFFNVVARGIGVTRLKISHYLLAVYHIVHVEIDPIPWMNIARRQRRTRVDTKLLGFAANVATD